MKKVRKFAQLLKVIWYEDILYWIDTKFFLPRRIDKYFKEGRCIRCGNLIESDRCQCHLTI